MPGRSLGLWLLLAVLPAGSVAVGGCETGHACALVACPDGLTIALDGTFDAGTTYRIDMTEMTPTPETVPVMTCILSPSDGGQQLFCSSAYQHIEMLRATRLPDRVFMNLQVTVSAGGVSLGTQSFDVMYTSREINGPGCGVCTTAAVHVTIP